jgi:hypothetical protein
MRSQNELKKKSSPGETAAPGDTPDDTARAGLALTTKPQKRKENENLLSHTLSAPATPTFRMERALQHGRRRMHFSASSDLQSACRSGSCPRPSTFLCAASCNPLPIAVGRAASLDASTIAVSAPALLAATEQIPHPICGRAKQASVVHTCLRHQRLTPGRTLHQGVAEHVTQVGARRGVLGYRGSQEAA